jgi:hypothetical protein
MYDGANACPLRLPARCGAGRQRRLSGQVSAIKLFPRAAIKLFSRVRPVGVVLLGPVGRGQLGHRRWRGPRWWPTAATLRASASAASAA